MARLSRFLLLASTLLLSMAAAADAATRYAAPGGTGSDPCADPAAPCSIGTAADGGAPGTTIAAGDVVELAPGTYSEAAGDLGPEGYVQPPPAVTVRGTPGAPRPVIVVEANAASGGAFFLGPGAELADVEIRNQAADGPALSVLDGAVEGVIARSSASADFTCTFFEGTMRSSACINTAGGTAIGVRVLMSAGVHTSVIRNTTAIATGSGSVGIDFAYLASEAGVIGAVDGIGVIAQGEAKDVIASGLDIFDSGEGATMTIELQDSDYAAVKTETSGAGSATVTAPGTNGNITAPALLAADRVHQLPGSPTVDEGAVDAASGSHDLDGQLREIGAAPDIGADELANPTRTSVSCAPSTIGPTVAATCTATVEDLGTVPAAPGGTVAFPVVSGLLVTGGCTLTLQTAGSSSCSGAFSWSGASGARAIAAIYKGDSSHEGSEGTTRLKFDDRPSGGPVGTSGNKAPVTSLKKHPPKQSAKRQARFAFKSNEAESRFECRLDNKPFRRCASPFRKKVKPGKHKFQVRAVDRDGKADPTPAVFRWRVLRG